MKTWYNFSNIGKKWWISQKNNPNILAINGHTPIHLAASGEYFDIVKLLMSTSDNPNALANNGWTPIHLAALGGHFDIVQLLRFTTDIPSALRVFM